MLACFIRSNNTLLVNLASLRNNCVELSAPQHDCQYALFHKFLVSCLFHRKKQENKSFNGNAFLCIFSCIFVPFVVVIFLLILYGCGSAALCFLRLQNVLNLQQYWLDQIWLPVSFGQTVAHMDRFYGSKRFCKIAMWQFV